MCTTKKFLIHISGVVIWIVQMLGISSIEFWRKSTLLKKNESKMEILLFFTGDSHPWYLTGETHKFKFVPFFTKYCNKFTENAFLTQGSSLCYKILPATLLPGILRNLTGVFLSMYSWLRAMSLRKKRYLSTPCRS